MKPGQLTTGSWIVPIGREDDARFWMTVVGTRPSDSPPSRQLGGQLAYDIDLVGTDDKGRNYFRSITSQEVLSEWVRV